MEGECSHQCTSPCQKSEWNNYIKCDQISEISFELRMETILIFMIFAVVLCTEVADVRVRVRLTSKNNATKYLNLTLKMAFAQVVETSIANNSRSQDSNHPDDFFQSWYVYQRANIEPSCEFHPVGSPPEPEHQTTYVSSTFGGKRLRGLSASNG